MPPAGSSAAPIEKAPPLADPFPVTAGNPVVERIHIKRYDMHISLPDTNGWSVARGKSRFAILDHAATSSRLVLRIWTESENTDRDGCEKRARLWREFPARGVGLSSRYASIPRGFDTRVDAGYTPRVIGHAGYLLAFGGGGKRCFAFAYTTSHAGPNAERIVGNRLVFMHGRVLRSIKLSETLMIDRQRHPL